MQENLLVKNLKIRTGFEGPQIVISFTAPDEDWDKIQVTRKLRAFPETPTDGVKVYENTSGQHNLDVKISDKDMLENHTHYYTVFTFLGDDVSWSLKTQGKALAIKTGIFENKLWNNLPELYRIHDRVGL